MITPEQLEGILPLACAWAEKEEAAALREGRPLNDGQLKDARNLGVVHPERVRLKRVDTMPRPEQPALRDVGWNLGLVWPSGLGMTLGYGVFIRAESWGVRALTCHELVHVSQYERLGGIAGFLRQYLLECITVGYPAGALEQEAIEKSQKHCMK